MKKSSAKRKGIPEWECDKKQRKESQNGELEISGLGVRCRPEGVGGKPMSIDCSVSTQASTIHSLGLAVRPLA